MNIVLTMNLPYLLSHSGAIRANRMLAEGLAAKGHTVTVVVPAVVPVLGAPSRMSLDEFISDLDGRNIEYRLEDQIVCFHYNGVAVRAITEPSHLRPALENIVDRLQPDRILVSCEDPSQNLLSAALKKEPDRVVYLVNTPTFLPFGPQAFYPSKTRTQWLEAVGAIVAGSRFVADYIRQWSNLNSTVFYWPVYGPVPFPDLSSFDEGFITMINPCKVKGLSLFLELARRNPDLKFAAVPSWGTTDADQTALAALGNVQLIPASQRFEEILAVSRILLVPSLWQESFGLAVVQAMLHGIPVLASNVGGLAEAKLGTDFLFKVNPIEQFGNELDENRLPKADVPPQDVTAWCQALRRLTTQRDYYRQHSRSAQEAAIRFVSGLNFDSFEQFLEHLPMERTRATTTKDSAPDGVNSTQASLEEQLSASIRGLTPQQQMLMMLRLKKRQIVAGVVSSPNSGGRKWNLLLPVQPRGGRPPVFMVHAFTGRAEFYAQLAKHLNPEQPLFALHAPDLYDVNAPEMEYPDIETMASSYVDAIQTVHKDGPFLLGGYSFGAAPAFAMANEIKRRGLEVGFLGILDSAPFHKTPHDLDDAGIVIGRVRDLENQARSADPISFQELENYDGEERLLYVYRQVKRSMVLPAGMDFAAIKKMVQRYRQRLRYLERYQPTEYDGDITLFLTARECRLREQMIESWARVSRKPLILASIPGDHDNLVHEPHVAGVGVVFEQHLRNAQARLFAVA